MGHIGCCNRSDCTNPRCWLSRSVIRGSIWWDNMDHSLPFFSFLFFSLNFFIYYEEIEWDEELPLLLLGDLLRCFLLIFFDLCFLKYDKNQLSVLSVTWGRLWRGGRWRVWTPSAPSSKINNKLRIVASELRTVIFPE